MSPKNIKHEKDIGGDRTVPEGHHRARVRGKMIAHGRRIGRVPKWVINAEHE
jgi:hypothetical protein